MTAVNVDSNAKTKVPDEFIFRRVSLVCFTSDVHVSLYIIKTIKTMAACVHAHEQLRLWFYVLVCYFVVLDIHL